MNKEVRFFDFKELRIDNAEGGTKLVGYSAVFNELSPDLGGFREKIAPGAFSDAIESDDIRALFNHDANIVLGRNKSGTLRLSEDDKGLRMEIDLPDTQAARDLAVSVGRGDISGQSFAFKVLPGGQNVDKQDDGTVIRTITKAQLFDVGPVTYPAYPQTDVAVRSMREAGFNEILPEKDLLDIKPGKMAARMKKVYSSMKRSEENNSDWVEIRNENDTGAVEVLIYDTIGIGTTRPVDFVKSLREFKGRDLHVRINSPGGAVFDGAAVYNALRQHDGRVNVDIDGWAASMAGIIAMAGETIRMNQNAFFMVHNASGCCMGDATEMEAEAKLLRQINKSLAQTLSARSGQDLDTVLAMMERETWLSAEEAKDMGFVDEIINSSSATLRSFDFSHFRNVPDDVKQRLKEASEKRGKFRLDAALRKQKLAEIM